MQIRIRINEEGLLRHQRHAFTNRYTLVTELLQNARRAGATRIDIEFDPVARYLRVQDDGGGIDDFQTLLSLHESGWDAATCAEEQPFGVGFSQCLYTATRCIVTSGGRRVAIDCAAALAGKACEVGPGTPPIAGTAVELHGVDLPDLSQRIDSLCEGFTVEVCFNGRLLERPLAPGRLATLPTPIGLVHLCGADDGRYSRDTLVFLQGFCVMRPPWCQADQVNVVHLDPRQFLARLPDRDRLIDEDVQYRRIEAELRSCWRQTLEQARSSWPGARFVATYYAALRAWGHLDLLNDLDTLPAALFERIVGYPIQVRGAPRDHVCPLDAAPTRAAIEAGDVTLVALDGVHEENAAHWMLARARGYLVFDWIGLPADHWVQRHVRFLEDQPVRVDALGELGRTRLDGRAVWPVVVLCQAVRIQLGDSSVEIDDRGVCHDGILFIPAGEHSGTAVQQLSSYVDEHEQFQEADLDADRSALADLVRHLRSSDPVRTLDALLQDLLLGRYPLLHGRSFRLSIGVGEMPGCTVELVEPVEADAPAAGAHHAQS